MNEAAGWEVNSMKRILSIVVSKAQPTCLDGRDSIAAGIRMENIRIRLLTLISHPMLKTIGSTRMQQTMTSEVRAKLNMALVPFLQL